jgi:hypothetical protein
VIVRGTPTLSAARPLSPMLGRSPALARLYIPPHRRTIHGLFR